MGTKAPACALTIGVDSVGLVFEGEAEFASGNSVMVERRLQSSDEEWVEEGGGAERPPVLTKAQLLTQLCGKGMTKLSVL